jgi:6-pyruvoyltetrahydropterin/6-carboxytetrahydropterin synthase
MRNLVVSKEFEFDAAHRLLNYAGPCAMLHGHRYKVVVSYMGVTLDDAGMLIDFQAIKETIGAWIQAHWDHAIILNADDPLADIVESTLKKEPPFINGQTVKLFRMKGNPTAENMARHLFMVSESLSDKPATRPLHSIVVYETPTSFCRCGDA